MNRIKIRRRQRFTRRFQAETKRRFESGEIEQVKFDQLMAKSSDYRLMDQALAEIETADGAWGDFDWAKLWQWIKDNWMEIAKLILSLVVMFADEEETE